MRRLARSCVLLVAVFLWMAALVFTSSSHASQLRVHVDRQAPSCHPVHCVQLRTVSWHHHHRVVLQVLQARHRPTESRNAPAPWGRWRTVASAGGFQ